METHKKRLMATVVVTLVLLGTVVPASAQEVRPEIIFGNGMGAEITELILSPAKDQYTKNRNRYAQALQVNDKAVFGVEIPEHLQRYESFDIEVVAGGKHYVTKHGIRLDRGKGTPVLELSVTGKDSTIGLITALTTTAGTVAFLTGTSAGRQALARIVYSLYRWKGFVILLSLPTIAGGIGYFVGNGLAPGGLHVQVAYIN